MKEVIEWFPINEWKLPPHMEEVYVTIQYPLSTAVIEAYRGKDSWWVSVRTGRRIRCPITAWARKLKGYVK